MTFLSRIKAFLGFQPPAPEQPPQALYPECDLKVGHDRVVGCARCGAYSTNPRPHALQAPACRLRRRASAPPSAAQRPRQPAALPVQRYARPGVPVRPGPWPAVPQPEVIEPPAPAMFTREEWTGTAASAAVLPMLMDVVEPMVRKLPEPPAPVVLPPEEDVQAPAAEAPSSPLPPPAAPEPSSAPAPAWESSAKPAWESAPTWDSSSAPEPSPAPEPAPSPSD